jgi:hypothetical protein
MQQHPKQLKAHHHQHQTKQPKPNSQAAEPANGSDKIIYQTVMTMMKKREVCF